jgi:protein phosphatase
MAPARGAVNVRLDCAGKSDKGLARVRNEDRILCDPERQVFAVADGVGGLPGGAIASAVAVDVLAEELRRVPERSLRDLVFGKDDQGPKLLENAVVEANQEIIAIAEAARKMATTLCAVLFRGDIATIAHVGDSRIYLLRAGTLHVLTKDHSLIAEMMAAGRMTPAEAEKFPWPNAISRALGLHDVVRPDLGRLTVYPGDVLLLCTDGVSAELPTELIVEILEAAADADSAVERLVAGANAMGGRDNISAVVVRVLDYV